MIRVVCREHQGGFTLIELMIVVLIIGVLVTIAIPVFSNVKETAEERTCFANERLMDGAIQTYVSSTGNPYPADFDAAMTVLIGQYLQWEEPECASGGTYEARLGGTPDMYITCAGANGHGTYRDGL